ncbi:hypothetical protein QVD17_10138 [Tagetes erecta]|uniref:Gnk2-homologous domain-containing protein n=1 Tax=Tagetes erecta TaxID=13708 RepID=A0AAD8L0I8_TARER|nr:hypothetical protein QVD17_10138 [Tagetes erecta]
MQTKYLTSLLMFLVQVLINSVIAQKPDPYQQSFKCNNIGDLKSDALVKSRDNAFYYLIHHMGIIDPYNGYAYGNGYGMYSIGLCPPNIKKKSCLECLNNTIPYLKKNCPKQKEGVAWTTSLSQVSCIVRYADYSINRTLSDWAWIVFSSPPNESFGNAVDLEKGVNDLANKLKERAVGGGEDIKFAFGFITYKSGSHSLYGSMQCTPTIDRGECTKCLSKAINEIHNCCSKVRKLSARAMSTNCYFQYAHYDFTFS